ncbi:alpha/beta fold hydrolase [Streptomyces sp. NPDC056160]|uniref:alpha/beta fold hydrolase n=1 Tax=Streptomyces sp. NPDC056160 TaxID=3345731 RepID=UPI0035E12564
MLEISNPGRRAAGKGPAPKFLAAARTLRTRSGACRTSWFATAYPRLESWLAGRSEYSAALAPFFYGRWDDTARAHAEADEDQTNEEAADRYFAEARFDPAATRAALGELAAPVLVLAGEADGGPRPELARRAAAAFAHAEFAAQPGAGHYPWLDDPEWFVRRVAAFLTGPRAALPSAE